MYSLLTIPKRLPHWLLAGYFLLQLTGCALLHSTEKEVSLEATPWAMASSTPQPTAHLTSPIPEATKPLPFSDTPQGTWQHYRLPGKQPTTFTYTRAEGRPAMAVTAVASASMLRKTVRLEPAALGKLRFSWKVPALIDGADLTQREGDDSPVRVVLAFEGDRSKFSARNAMLSELARALTGEELPYATLMYVWGNHRAPGTVIVNPRTDRIRKLVLESGPGRLNRWLDYERDIRADYEKAFGEAPGALLAIGIMTDTDNTGGHTRAWYGPVTLVADTLPKR